MWQREGLSTYCQCSIFNVSPLQTFSMSSFPVGYEKNIQWIWETFHSEIPRFHHCIKKKKWFKKCDPSAVTVFIYKDTRRCCHIYTALRSHSPLRLCRKRQVSRRLLHQHFSAGQCPSLQSTSIQGGHRSPPPLFTLTSSLAGLNIRPGSSEACVSDSHSVRSWLGAADICNSFPAL